MRRISLERIKGNEILARSIFAPNGMILLSQGTQIKRSYISRLLELGIDYIYIEDALSKGVEIKDFIEEKTRNESKKEVKKLLEKYSSQGKVELTNIIDVAQNIVDDILSQRDLVVNLIDIRRKDEYTYAHSVNVCALAVLTSIKLGYNIQRVKDIAVGALLHDLGKVLISEDILNKPDILSDKEIEIVKQHVIHGYEAVNEASWLSAISKVIILTHHERIDGSGYPFGWSGDKINQAAKIVAVCDVFDAMTTMKAYRQAYKTYEVIEYLTAMKGHLFDTSVVDVFLKHIAVYPSGVGVITNKKQKGIVLKQNASFPTRPVIRLLKENETTVDDWVEINLSEDTTTFIIDTFEV